MKMEEIGDRAMESPVQRIAQRAADDEAERRCRERTRGRALQTQRTADTERLTAISTHCAPPAGEPAIGNAAVPGEDQIEKGKHGTGWRAGDVEDV